MIGIRIGDGNFGCRLPGALSLRGQYQAKWQKREEGSAKYAAEPGNGHRRSAMPVWEGQAERSMKKAHKAQPGTIPGNNYGRSSLYNLQRILTSEETGPISM